MLQSRASAALGTTSLYKREIVSMSGVVQRHRPGRAGDLMLRNFEVYDIADNQLTDAVSLGQVGWAVRRLSPNGLQRLHRQNGAVRSALSPRIVHAMASFGDDTADASTVIRPRRRQRHNRRS